jgi:hypothetical protein
MKRHLLLLLLSAAAVASAQEGPPPPPRNCSLATLQGQYLYAQDGTNDRAPFAQSGIDWFDGAGKVKGIYTASENGTIRRGTYTATYTLKSDCSGTLTIADSSKKTFHYDIFTVPGGDEIVWVQTDPGSVSAGWERRRPGPPPMRPR